MFVRVAVIPVSVAERHSYHTGVDQSPDDTDFTGFRALVDTGAQSTCLTQAVAAAAGLKPIGKVPIQGVGGLHYHNNYLFHIGFVLADQGRNGAVEGGRLFLLDTPIQGAEFASGGGFDVLLGMDIIGIGSLSVEGSGTFSFCF